MNFWIEKNKPHKSNNIYLHSTKQLYRKWIYRKYKFGTIERGKILQQCGNITILWVFTAWSILFVELLSWLRFAAEHEELMHSGSFESLVLACDHGRCTLIANVSLAKCLLAIWKS